MVEKANRRFVNVYEIIQIPGRRLNDVKAVATFEGKNYKEAKAAFDIIKLDEQWANPRFSVQIQDVDGKKLYGPVEQTKENKTI